MDEGVVFSNTDGRDEASVGGGSGGEAIGVGIVVSKMEEGAMKEGMMLMKLQGIFYH